MEISGRSLIGSQEGAAASGTFQAWNPARGEKIEPAFYPASQQEVDLAARLAAQAFSSYSNLSGSKKAVFLRSIASGMEAIADLLVERAQQETGLPTARLQSETARTCGQLRLFASVVEEGSWVGARIDRADAQRQPLPKPDVRSMWHAIGPVVVFGASNFPLAFSVAGGDTASALSAGNPVIVKAHPAHPGTSELAGRVIRENVRKSGLHEGVFSLLFDSGTDVGSALVEHPLVKAVGFTGSLAAGRALLNRASLRPEPIPFYGEMGSTNPVFLLPRALAERSAQIAAGLHKSFTLGGGQFCTKPGIIFLPDGKASASFVSEFRKSTTQSPRFTLLTSGIRSSYRSKVEKRKGRGVPVIAEGEQPGASPAFLAGAAVFEASMASFLGQREELEAEVFGPTTLLIHFSEKEEILQAARHLGGHLTATIHGTEQDLREFAALVEILRNKVGRIIFNGYPTGVEVDHAMIHGGPYPASTDSRTTSVGSQAIYRFARPVCYQDFPDSALPNELKNSNPLKIWRMIDGEWVRDHLDS